MSEISTSLQLTISCSKKKLFKMPRTSAVPYFQGCFNLFCWYCWIVNRDVAFTFLVIVASAMKFSVIHRSIWNFSLFVHTISRNNKHKNSYLGYGPDFVSCTFALMFYLNFFRALMHNRRLLVVDCLETYLLIVYILESQPHII